MSCRRLMSCLRVMSCLCPCSCLSCQTRIYAFKFTNHVVPSMSLWLSCCLMTMFKPFKFVDCVGAAPSCRRLRHLPLRPCPVSGFRSCHLYSIFALLVAFLSSLSLTSISFFVSSHNFKLEFEFHVLFVTSHAFPTFVFVACVTFRLQARVFESCLPFQSILLQSHPFALRLFFVASSKTLPFNLFTLPCPRLLISLPSITLRVFSYHSVNPHIA